MFRQTQQPIILSKVIRGCIGLGLALFAATSAEAIKIPSSIEMEATLDKLRDALTRHPTPGIEGTSLFIPKGVLPDDFTGTFHCNVMGPKGQHFPDFKGSLYDTKPTVDFAQRDKTWASGAHLSVTYQFTSVFIEKLAHFVGVKPAAITCILSINAHRPGQWSVAPGGDSFIKQSDS